MSREPVKRVVNAVTRKCLSHWLFLSKIEDRKSIVAGTTRIIAENQHVNILCIMS